MLKSKYILQPAERTRCANCGTRPTLLCREDGIKDKVPWFYICWKCERVVELAKGECYFHLKD